MVATEAVLRPNRNASGTTFMLLSVVGYSLIPLLIANGGGQSNPFLFAAGIKVGVGVGLAVFLLASFGRVLLRRDVLQLIAGRLLTVAMLFMLINQ